MTEDNFDKFGRYGTRHGSPNGMRRHLKLDTEPCDLCIQGAKDADRRYRAKRVSSGKDHARGQVRALALKRLMANHRMEWQWLLWEARQELEDSAPADNRSVG
jgi:hypothetical protein